MKRPAQVNIGIDRDARAIEVFRRSAHSYLSPAASLKLTVGSGLEFLRTYPFRGDELCYLDPPYLMSARRQSRRLYRYELSTEAEHAELLRLLVTLPCMVMLSGYRSELYDTQLVKWRREEFYTSDRGGNRKLENVWLNFPAPLELHDYQYLGQGFRERERIKRKRARWRAKLERMPELERHAILAEIEALRSSAPRLL
jgi:hypothetical protein